MVLIVTACCWWQVDPPPGSGASHDRKIKSYAVEASFYTHYSHQLLAAASACAVSQPLLVDVSPPHHFFFLLSDLTEHFPERIHSYTFEEAQAALDWLASFHAYWWEALPGQQQLESHNEALPLSAATTVIPAAAAGTAAADANNVSNALWDQGCYWHLDTRQEEYRNMDSSWKELRAAAADIDSVLKGLLANGSKTNKHRTLLHGDFKSENVLFNAEHTCCAAYDFQYCGEGLGMRDVAYMLASSVDQDVVQQQEEQLLDHYHNELVGQLHNFGKAAAAGSYTREVMKAQLDLCVADYVRFMAGWGMWGNHHWACRRARQVLKQLEAVKETARTGW
eukprot:GHRR01027012.1.p1 GENE.GHRR01027012.1~~GHRR01027012.1.p1  ORF type:complete len:337 (+),score=117.66 GHRR01027012.1:452-1462(+)